MIKIKYDDFEKAVNILGLIGLENRSEIKSRYLYLSKKYHPDMPEGSNEKFQEISHAYKVIQSYIDNFKFRFTLDEFADQHPFAVPLTKESLTVSSRK